MVLQKIVDVNDNSIEVESKKGNVYSVYFNSPEEMKNISDVRGKINSGNEAFAEISFENEYPEIEELMPYVPYSIKESRKKSIIYNPKEEEVRNIPEESYINIVVEDGEDIGVYFVSEQVDPGLNLIKDCQDYLMTFFGRDRGEVEVYNNSLDNGHMGVVEEIEIMERR